MPEKLRIVFMGTPEFAVPSLDILVKNGYEVAAAVTAPDKPAGRGLQLQQSAVKKYAVEHKIPVLQPLKLKDENFLKQLKSFDANLFIIVAFRMLPEVVWNMPEKGTFNLHASLLPDYRGAAPINWAIINGEEETGLTTFFLQQEIDTGPVLFQSHLKIDPDESAGELHDRMMTVGAELVLRTVKAIESEEIEPLPQPRPASLKPAPKIFKDDCKIDWDQPIYRVYDFIRGLSPYPAAWTMLNGKVFKIYRTLKEPALEEVPPGTFLSDNRTYLKVATLGGYIQLLEVQLEGKKRMAIEEFLRGFRIQN